MLLMLGSDPMVPTEITQIPSPNFGPRKGGATPDLVLIHYTGMETAQAAIARLCDPVHEVSAHYVIAEDGTTSQLVPEDMRAWHAGAGRWGTCQDINSASIGIELANPGPLKGFPPFPEPQMQALETLLAAIRTRWPIRAVLGHSDTAPGRKADPGPKFDWSRIDGGPIAPGHPSTPLAAMLTTLGYDPDADPDHRLAAFRLRFSPCHRAGPECATDRALAAGVIDRLGPAR